MSVINSPESSICSAEYLEVALRSVQEIESVRKMIPDPECDVDSRLCIAQRQLHYL